MTITGSCPDTLATRFAYEHLERYLRSVMGMPDVDKFLTAIWFHRLPDFSPSLNDTRLAIGLPVGGLLGWNASCDFVPPGVPANGCGMAVARVSRSAGPHQVIDALKRVAQAGLQVRDYEIQWDAGRKNHFLSVYSDKTGKRYAILHCSFPEGKLAEDSFFPCENPADVTRRKPLFEEAARSFRAHATELQTLGIQKRQLLLESIFGEVEIVSNRSHVGFVDGQVVVMGCYAATTPIDNSPLTVAPRKNAFLVSTRSPTDLPCGPLYIQPHGTGNASSLSGTLSYFPNSGLFECAHPSLLTDSAQDVFDTHMGLEECQPWLASWLDNESVELRLDYEVVLRKGFPVRGIE